MAGWRLEHTYAALPEIFYSDAQPAPVPEPRLVIFNKALAAELGLDVKALDSPEGAGIFRVFGDRDQAAGQPAGNTEPEAAAEKPPSPKPAKNSTKSRAKDRSAASASAKQAQSVAHLSDGSSSDR